MWRGFGQGGVTQRETTIQTLCHRRHAPQATRPARASGGSLNTRGGSSDLHHLRSEPLHLASTSALVITPFSSETFRAASHGGEIGPRGVLYNGLFLRGLTW